MYALLINPESGLPTVISINDKNYPDFIMSGYKQEDTGHKNEMQEQADEILSEIYMN